MGKVYAVRKGNTKGLFYTWDECKAATSGFSGAEYRSFRTESEAKAYLEGEIHGVDQSLLNPVAGRCVIYVNFGHDKETNEHAYGVHLQTQERNFGICSLLNIEDAMLSIKGEGMGILLGLQAALTAGYRDLVIIYRYDGMREWAELQWKAKGVFQKHYQISIQNLRNMYPDMKITFVKAGSNTDLQGVREARNMVKRAFKMNCTIPEHTVLNLALSIDQLKGDCIVIGGVKG